MRELRNAHVHGIKLKFEHIDPINQQNEIQGHSTPKVVFNFIHSLCIAHYRTALIEGTIVD